jgi:CheY-like chemotaxis protein
LAALKDVIARDLLPAEPFRSLASELSGHESILVVDDNEIMRVIAQEILEGFGYRVLVARDSLLASSWHDPIDLMMLDVPLLDADHLMRVRLAKQCVAASRVVVCTLLPEGSAREHLRAQGVDNFISKPFHPLALARCIRQTLDLST